VKRGVRTISWRKLILFGSVVAVGVAVLALASCAWFNIFPIAGFTIGPSTTGPVPFAVTVSGAASSDKDGDIETYAWDFGDGTTGAGVNAAHTYSTVGTYTIILTVTDNWGATDSAAKTVYATAAAPAGPSASFTTSASSGTSPLSVTVNASGSTYPGGTISAYEWTFGDGGTGFGQVTSHTYFTSSSRTYTITLLVRGSDGKTGTASKSVTVSPVGGGGTTPSSDAPSARFDIDKSVGVAPFQVHFDPTDSEAGEGRVIILYTWSFGDTEATSSVNPTVMEHVYVTDSPSETFTVTLLVLDNEGESDSITKTVKIYNHKPIAGFDIANPPGGISGNAGVVEYTSAADAYTNCNDWVEDDVVYGDIFNNNGLGGAFPVTTTVVIRSRALEDDWYELTDTGDQTTLTLANGTLATSSSVPSAPNDADGNDYDDHNFSYDPEGQAWDLGGPPAWFTAPTDYGQAWGIRYLLVNWGDGTAQQQVNYADVAGDYDGNVVVAHDYNVTTDGTSRTITVTAEDWLGQKSVAFSRTVTLTKGFESP
jgi:PKD repeat protein